LFNIRKILLTKSVEKVGVVPGNPWLDLFAFRTGRNRMVVDGRIERIKKHRRGSIRKKQAVVSARWPGAPIIHPPEGKEES
jgi:hypothetical protein